MGIGVTVGILVSLLLLLGGLLYIAAQFLINKIKKESFSLRSRKAKLWIWRSFIVVLFLYSLFIIVANKAFLLSFFYGPFEIFLVIILVIYFVALVELVVIDLLLPDVIAMWKRILIEVIVFVLLCTLTVVTFNVSTIFISSMG